MILGQGEGVDDYAVFTALDLVHLVRLLFDAHVLVDDADTALSGNGDRHFGLGNGVHGRGHNGGLELDLACQGGAQLDHVGGHIGLAGDQQHIVKGQSLF